MKIIDYICSEIGGGNCPPNREVPTPSHYIFGTKPIRYKMKEIKLTHGYVAQIDDDDFDRVSRFKWTAYVKKGYDLVYAYRGICTPGSKLIKSEFMHRFILSASCGISVDHIDHNGLNNQKSNLRCCSHTNNIRNRRPNRGKRYRGVTKTPYGRYMARIVVDCKAIYLGTYLDEITAAMVYDKAAIEYYGEYARLNFPTI